MTKCNIERKTKKKKKTKRRLDGEKRRMVQTCTQKMERYRSRGWVDRHLPSSNQQRTTYRCQYDWFGCLFGCAYSAPLLSLASFRFIFGVFSMFLLIVCCALTVDRDRQSQWNVNATKYMAPSQLPAQHNRRLRIQNKGNFVLLSFTFHIHWIYIHGHCVYYLLLPLFQFAWHFSLFSYIFVCVHVMCTFFIFVFVTPPLPSVSITVICRLTVTLPLNQIYNIIFKGRIEVVCSVRFEGDRTNIYRGVRIICLSQSVHRAHTNKSEKAALAEQSGANQQNGNLFNVILSVFRRFTFVSPSKHAQQVYFTCDSMSSLMSDKMCALLSI